MENLVTCPYCGKILNKNNSSHLRICIEFFNFIEKNKNEIYEKYYNEEYSMVDISNYFKIPYSHAQKIFKILKYPIRGITESKQQKLAKEKYKATMLKNWGTEHNFNKNCLSRKNWEKKLLEEEGIVNVFQREDVKRKIKETTKNKYSDEEIYYNYTKGSTLQYWIDKLGEEEGTKKHQEICYNKGKSNRLDYYIEKYGKEEGEILFNKKIHDCCTSNNRGYHTSINEGMKDILDKNNIPYVREYVIKRIDEPKRHYSYDFLIDNKLIIEMNGRFWHADPRWYKEGDVMNFPGRKENVSDIWEKDKNKKMLALSNGYKFLTIWEDDFNNSDKSEILKLIKNEISKN